MDKLVYLHELDSVRMTGAEIDAARELLYDEIVSNGNTVVLTFNQLADSRAFLGLAMESPEMLATIKGLMLNGAIKVSRYSDKRTASQYLQDNLKPRPSGSHGKFVLSGWGIPDQLNIEERERIRDGIYRALRNSDTASLDLMKKAPEADLSLLCAPGKDITFEQYNEALEKMERLVDLMLAISNSPLSYVDVNESASPSFAQYLEKVLDEKRTFVSDDARALLGRTQGQLQEGERAKRSPYYRLLEKVSTAGEGASCLAAAQEAARALDVCYNLTAEASIRSISKHYDPMDEESLASEVAGRLEAYRASYEELGHSYPWHAEPALSARKPNQHLAQWQHALRVRTAAAPQSEATKAGAFPSESASKEEGAPLYERRMAAEKAEWCTRVRRALARNILVMVLYAVILSFVEVIISLVQDMMVSWMNLGNDTISDLVSDQGSIVSIVIFLVGILIFARTDDADEHRSRRMLIAFLAVLFVIVLPLLSCMSLSFEDGALSVEADFASLPSMLAMGIPNLVASLIGVALFAYVGWLIEEKLGMPGIIDSAVAALSSARDLLAFGAEGAPERTGYLNERTKGEPEDAQAKGTETGAEPPFDLTSTPGEQKDEWERYLAATTNDPDGASAPIKVIKDHGQVLEFEREPQGVPIGIMYSSPYSQLIVDLVEDKTGRRFAYERLIPTNSGAVVIVPSFEGKLVLLRQFRHALRSYQLSFPRGYGEPGLSAEENAAKELHEELGASAAGDLTYLGSVVADSGLSGNEASVFACIMDELTVKRGYEGIEGYELFTPEELDAAICEGRITDGFTLSALTLLRCSGAHEAFSPEQDVP